MLCHAVRQYFRMKQLFPSSVFCTHPTLLLKVKQSLNRISDILISIYHVTRRVISQKTGAICCSSMLFNYTWRFCWFWDTEMVPKGEAARCDSLNCIFLVIFCVSYPLNRLGFGVRCVVGWIMMRNRLQRPEVILTFRIYNFWNVFKAVTWSIVS
jgi:hypothetical protein